MGLVWVSYLHQSWVILVQIGVYLHQSLPRDCRLVFICTRVDWETADWCLQPDKTAASAICTKLTLSSGTFAHHPIWWEFVLRASKSNLFFQDFVESTWITRHIGLGLVCGVSQSISQSGLNIDSDSAGRLPWVLLPLCLVQPKKEKTLWYQQIWTHIFSGPCTANNFCWFGRKDYIQMKQYLEPTYLWTVSIIA